VAVLKEDAALRFDIGVANLLRTCGENKACRLFEQ